MVDLAGRAGGSRMTHCPVCAALLPAPFLVRDPVPVHQNLVMDDVASARALSRGTLRLHACGQCGFVCNAAFDSRLLSYGAAYDNTQSCSPAFEAYLEALADYVAAGIASPRQADTLRAAIADRKSIVVVGGTSSGKTTLVNALLAEIAGLDERVIILEDTRELNCAAKDCVALRTRPGVATLADLVRSTLRLRPDRIIVGEVRGREALDMLKAWNTGHPGGITTIHANSALSALYRLEQLVQEAVITVPRDLIVEAVDLVVFLSGRGAKRKIETVAEVVDLDQRGDYVLKPLGPPALHAV